jgi:hypothetical protein
MEESSEETKGKLAKIKNKAHIEIGKLKHTGSDP